MSGLRRAVVLLAALGAWRLPAQGTSPPASSYFVFVTSEARDLVTLIRFAPQRPVIEHRTPVALDSVRDTAPNAIRMVPGGRSYLVTTTNGFPHGELLKFAIAADSNPVSNQPPDTATGREPVGDAPAAIDISPDGELAWVTNRGAGSASGSISIVYLGAMTEAARITTCASAHGSRLSADGTHHYSVCTADNTLIDVDPRTMAVTRRLALPPLRAGSADSVACAPVAAEPAPNGGSVFVACRGSGEILEISVPTGAVVKRISVPGGVASLAMTHDGRHLIVAARDTQVVSIVSTAAPEEVHRIVTARHAPAGAVVSSDDKYAFVAVAGTGSEPGTVMMIDLSTFATIAAIDVAARATGIEFWKIEASKPPK